MGRRLATALGTAVLTSALVAGTTAATAPAAGAAAAAPRVARAAARACPPTPFTSAFVTSLTKAYPHLRVTASVYDTRSDCWYSLHPGLRLTTASVIKAGVLGAVLLRAQDRGRGLTSWELARATPMIRYSYNNPYVSDLLGRVGGPSGMHRFDVRMGAYYTTERSAYGATTTTAYDRTKVSLGMLYGLGRLRAPGRAVAWKLMSDVTPTQRWGITAGVPAGWKVAQKNGFYPMKGYGWRVGSTGFVRRPGSVGGYAITVMTDHGSTQVQGIGLVERVSRQVAARLAGSHPAARVVDRSRCVTTRAGQSWTTVARAVGRPSSAWRDVRRVSGGNPAPLQGQRACSNVLRPA